MFLRVLVLVGLVVAGRPSASAPPSAASDSKKESCIATPQARDTWMAAQGTHNDYFSDSPDIWGFTNQLPPTDATKEFYFAVADYICKASPADSGCSTELVSLTQSCTQDYVDVKAVLDVRNANTFVGTINYERYGSTLGVNAMKVLYGCRLNQDTKTPSTTSPAQYMNCGDESQWRDWLATSSGRFAYTYRIFNSSCTCSSPSDMTHYNIDISRLPNYNADYAAANSNKKIVQQDHDVSFSGHGSFNYGASEDFAGVPGVHQIKQAYAGDPAKCPVEGCYSSTKGSQNVKLNPLGGDYLALRETLKGLFAIPSLPSFHHATSTKKNNPTRGPQRQPTLLRQALKQQ